MSSIIKKCAIAIVVIGFIAGIIAGNKYKVIDSGFLENLTEYPLTYADESPTMMFNTWMMFSVWISSVLLAFFVYIFGEIVELLEELNYKLDNVCTSLNKTEKQHENDEEKFAKSYRNTTPAPKVTEPIFKD